ncbi:hypothetical protein EFL93_07450 [Weissella confusa]|nr:hypothetical protein [Weissella confusa]
MCTRQVVKRLMWLSLCVIKPKTTSAQAHRKEKAVSTSDQRHNANCLPHIHTNQFHERMRLFMSNSIISDTQTLAEAINRLAETLGNNSTPWMSKTNAARYAKLNYRTFQKLVDTKKIPVHSLYEAGVAKELYNKNELDEAIKRL